MPELHPARELDVETSNMRFMMMVKADRNYEAGAPPSPELMEAMDRLIEDTKRAGVLLETEGLLPSFAGARVRADGGKLTVTDGPFSEAKELIGGYAIVKGELQGRGDQAR
ncbi:MAG TPA: YciI family protein [Bryobacteraceae bacterium]|nr:YciI family protein [Bryobacteraceae bacterium]